jgi:uncharacterized membrane protein
VQIDGSYRIDIGGAIAEGWSIYQRAPLLLSGVTLLQIALNALASTVPLLNTALYGPLLGGLYIIVMRLDRNQPVQFANYFDAFALILPLALASVVSSLLISLGILLLILPGLYLALAYGFTYLNIIDRRMDFWPAMEASRKLITAHFWQYLLLALLFLVICALGAIPLGLGLLVAIPVCVAAQYSVYRDLLAHYADAPY